MNKVLHYTYVKECKRDLGDVFSSVDLDITINVQCLLNNSCVYIIYISKFYFPLLYGITVRMLIKILKKDWRTNNKQTYVRKLFS